MDSDTLLNTPMQRAMFIYLGATSGPCSQPLKIKNRQTEFGQCVSPAQIYTHQTCWKGAFHALPLQDVCTCQLMAPQMQLTNAAHFWPPNCMVPQYHVVLCGVICESSTCISNELAVKTGPYKNMCILV